MWHTPAIIAELIGYICIHSHLNLNFLMLYVVFILSPICNHSEQINICKSTSLVRLALSECDVYLLVTDSSAKTLIMIHFKLEEKYSKNRLKLLTKSK